MRSFSAEKKGLWTVAAILASAGGMLSKQVMVTAPLIVLLYDWVFVSSSLKEAWQKHRGLHIGLASTWCLLVLTFIASPVNETAGFAVKTISPLEYYLSQFRVVVQYVRVVLYPDALSIDYSWKKATTIGEIIPYAIPILILQVATLWGIYRRKPLAFLGAWFFGILAVTSSFMPFSDLVFEHRMYLPLAAVVAAFVFGGDWAARRLAKPGIDYLQDSSSVVRKVALALVVLLVLTLSALTVRRNIDYKSEFTLWVDAVVKQPQSSRARNNLGKQLQQQGLLEAATVQYAEAVTHDPDNLIGRNNLGLALTQLGRAAEGKDHLLYAVSLRPNFYLSHLNLGHNLVDLDEVDQAIEHLTTAIELNPKEAESHYYLGLAYQKAGRYTDALGSLDHTFELDPKYTDAVSAKALLYLTARDPNFKSVAEAIRWAEWATQLTRRRYGKPLDVLAQCYAEAGRYQEAVAAATEATNSLYARLHKDFAAASAARLAQYRAALSLAKANPRASTPS
jgi:tetratricopeptide (TPR) repeat protein